ncbi:hypothetical protein BMF29_12325 [Comamonas kerstersii]|nr:hypothetical protein BMF38_15530 [Comamonas kerstersii]OOH90738.1 hypothetical protein BMF29_12325 [Comamonas kerstersii]
MKSSRDELKTTVIQDFDQLMQLKHQTPAGREHIYRLEFLVYRRKKFFGFTVKKLLVHVLGPMKNSFIYCRFSGISPVRGIETYDIVEVEKQQRTLILLSTYRRLMFRRFMHAHRLQI